MNRTPPTRTGATMPLAEAMRTQRAVRRLREDPVSDDLLHDLIELAMRAPSGGNRQPQRFVIVRDPSVKRSLARLNRWIWSIARALYCPFVTSERQRRIVRAVQWQADHFERIPVVVVACLERPVPPWPPLLASNAYGSIYPSVQNLLLAARAEGLGAALTTFPVWSRVLARRVLGLPLRVHPVAAVPLGWPRERYGPNTRRPAGEVIHVDRWGHQPFR